MAKPELVKEPRARRAHVPVSEKLEKLDKRIDAAMEKVNDLKLEKAALIADAKQKAEALLKDAGLSTTGLAEDFAEQRP